jgi:hypothetical protein
MKGSPAPWLVISALAAASCGDLDLGDITYFSYRFESDDLTGWNHDDGQTSGSHYTLAGGQTTIAKDPLRDRGRSLLLEVPGQPGRQEHAAVSRFGRLPAEAYYGFSVLWPRRQSIAGYWSFLQFRGPAGESSNPTDDVMWELGVVNADDGAMQVDVRFQQAGGSARSVAVIPVAIPENQWIRFELRVRLATTATGLVALRMNGEPVFLQEEAITGRSDFYRVFFSNVGQDIAPRPAQLFVDDVVISPVPWPHGAGAR